MDLTRCRAGLPVSNPTPAFWQTEPISHERLRHSKTAADDCFDVIIIGSGITGATIAYDLLVESGSQWKVLMLEARDVCSGATGRNGGHVKPDRYVGFDDAASYHGADAARAQLKLENECYKALTAFIESKGIADRVDLVRTRAFDTYMTAEAWAWGKAKLERFKAAGGDTTDIEVHEGEEATSKSGVRCVAAISFPAATVWAYKVAAYLLEQASDRGLLINTYEPVTAVELGKEGTWQVTSKKASYKAVRVVHATNGYSSFLLPEFAGRILPIKGHVCAVRPTNPSATLPGSAGIHWREDFDYLIQRQREPRHIVIGGGDLRHPDGLYSVLGQWDDSTITTNIATFLEKFPRRFICHEQKLATENPTGDIKEQNTEPPHIWSGVYAISKDTMPFVGELPGKPRQFICAGYHGHGMVKAFLCARGLACLMQVKPVPAVLPKQYSQIQPRLMEPFDISRF